MMKKNKYHEKRQQQNIRKNKQYIRHVSAMVTGKWQAGVGHDRQSE